MSASQGWTAASVSLAAEVLRRSGFVRLRVRGESMLPSLGPGDIVEVVPASLSEVQPGEIVLARRDDRFFLHRFVASTASAGFLTRGDSMAQPDPSYDSEALLGKVVRVVHNGLPTLAPLQARPWTRALGALCCYNGLVRRLILKFGWSPRPAVAAQVADVVEI
jgi:Peptidase S24-like